MTTYLIVFEPPTVKNACTLESDEYRKCVLNLERLKEQRTNLRSVTENCLHITGGDAVGTLQDVISLLPEGIPYNHTTLTEDPEWQNKVKMTKKI